MKPGLFFKQDHRKLMTSLMIFVKNLINSSLPTLLKSAEKFTECSSYEYILNPKLFCNCMFSSKVIAKLRFCKKLNSSMCGVTRVRVYYQGATPSILFLDMISRILC